jgi:hypothetical protein
MQSGMITQESGHIKRELIIDGKDARGHVYVT